MNYYTDALQKYVVFNGRATRKQYWMYFLINIIISVAISIIATMLGLKLLSSLYSLAVILPSLAIGSRRLHDTGRSAWWLLICFVPIIGSFVLLFFTVQDTQTGNNKYGANPKAENYVSETKNVWNYVVVALALLTVIVISLSIWGIVAILQRTNTLTLDMKYTTLQNDSYEKNKIISSQPLDVQNICPDQRVINYKDTSSHYSSNVGGNWQKIDVVDCGANYYVMKSSDAGPALFGPFKTQRVE